MKVATEVEAPRIPAATSDADRELWRVGAVRAVSTSCTVVSTVGCSVTVYMTSACAPSSLLLISVAGVASWLTFLTKTALGAICRKEATPMPY